MIKDIDDLAEQIAFERAQILATGSSCSLARTPAGFVVRQPKLTQHFWDFAKAQAEFKKAIKRQKPAPRPNKIY